MKIKKTLTIISSMVLLSGVMLTPASVISAEASQNSDVNSTNVEETEERFSVSGEDNKFTIFDNELNENVTITYTDDNSGTIINTAGEVEEFFRDEQGNVYVNGSLAVESTVVPIEEEIEISPNQTTTWTHFNTQRTTQSNIDNANSLALGLISLLPIPGVGSIATIAGIINTLQSMGQDEVYVQLDQYHNPTYDQIRNDLSYYSDSGYTNLIDTTSSIQRLR